MLLWVVLVLSALWPGLRETNSRSIIFLVIVSVVSIGLLFAAGLMWGKKPHLAMAEYWRWWVVHLWVEGIFEVFATAIISLLFVHMGLVRTSTATVMVLFATIIFLFGGVLGTFHHLYFTGTPIAIIAAGATFSALEVVPLMVVGFEAYNHAKIEGQAAWEANYRWPFMFFTAVLFWNLVGAGIFGFLINPPLALYFMQGLNTTANHGHAALLGVYGMLGLGLTLYCVRGLTDVRLWDQKALKLSFWCLNIGLAMMTFLSLLPQGLWQTYASASHGYVYARPAEFMQSPIMHVLPSGYACPPRPQRRVGALPCLFRAFVSREAAGLSGPLRRRHAKRSDEPLRPAKRGLAPRRNDRSRRARRPPHERRAAVADIRSGS